MKLFLCSSGWTAALAVLAPAAFGANLTTTAVEATGQNWNSPAIWQTNIGGAASGPLLSPVAGNTYTMLFNGVDSGNASSNTRIRNPSGPSSTFPGDSLTINVNCELREKSGNNGAVLNFPGIDGNPGLVLNGGIINAGESQPLPFQVTGVIQVTHQSYISDGAGGPAAVFRRIRAIESGTSQGCSVEPGTWY